MSPHLPGQIGPRQAPRCLTGSRLSLPGDTVHHHNCVGICVAAFLPSEGADISASLPQEPNSFVGRERELAELCKLVGETRMLTSLHSSASSRSRPTKLLGSW